jgi:hypothetical protein
MVDLLLVEVSLLQRVGRIPQAVSLLERLRYPTFSHESVLTLYSRSHAPKNHFRVLNDTMSVLRQKHDYSSPSPLLTASESVSHSP